MSRSSFPAVLLLATLVTGGVLLACGGGPQTTRDVVTDTTQGPIPRVSETRQALTDALQTFNRHCLAPAKQDTDGTYPLDVFNPSPSAPSFKYRQLRALATVGLLDTTITRGQEGLLVHRFSLTEAGRAAQYDIAQTRTYKPMFCYAVPHVVHIDSIKAVYNSGPNPLANVWFAYSYRNLGDWRRHPAIRRTFPALPSLPSPSDTLQTDQLLIRVDGEWMDRRLSGYGRPAARSEP